MYKTKIKEKYKDAFKGFWWSSDDTYDVIATMGNMSLLYCEETGLVLDIYSNKIEDFRHVSLKEHVIEVEAKNMEYADRFDLHDTYRLVGFKETNPLRLIIENAEGRHEMLPSRLRVVSIK
jgi:hypothetical protein